jgi:hypothetical protein
MTHAKEKCEAVYGISNLLITWNNNFTNSMSIFVFTGSTHLNNLQNLTPTIMYNLNIILSLA